MNNLACQLAEVKFAGNENDMSFSGYGAVFGNVDLWRRDRAGRLQGHAVARQVNQ
jgi:hypothetical protein